MCNAADYRGKIDCLTSRGYGFLGSLSEGFTPWISLKLGYFLFVKDNKYYQYQLKSLFSGKACNIVFDENDEPLESAFFSKIISGDYIYVIYVHPGKNEHILILRPDPSVTGHAHILGHYKEDTNAIIVGGEVYFHSEKTLLINHKSGSFQTSSLEALRVINQVWGARVVPGFYPEVEQSVVATEVSRRRSDADALTRAQGAAHRPGSTPAFFRPPSEPVSSAAAARAHDLTT